MGDLHDEQEGDYFDAEFAPVNVVSQEEIVLLGELSELFEDVGEVEELAVYIADDGDGSLQSQHVRLSF